MLFKIVILQDWREDGEVTAGRWERKRRRKRRSRRKRRRRRRSRRSGLMRRRRRRRRRWRRRRRKRGAELPSGGSGEAAVRGRGLRSSARCR